MDNHKTKPCYQIYTILNNACFRDQAQEYIKDPKAKVPGTKMSFAGLSKQSDIDNLIVYLKSFGPDGKKIP